MSLKSTLIFFLFAILFVSDWALICKNCNVECDEQTDEECLEPGEDQETACLHKIFKDENNKTLHQRKCVLFKKYTRLACADYPHYKTISCVLCKTDRCNVDRSSNTSSTTNTTNTSRGLN